MTVNHTSNETEQCAGCGAKLQSESQDKPGYIPATAKSRHICQRCFRIKNYNEASSVAIDQDDFLRLLSGIGGTDSLVVHIVDLFDFEGSVISGLQRFVGNNPVLLVVNKTDLEAPPIWLSELGLSAEPLAVSALEGRGIDALRAAILDLSGGREGLEQDGILVTNARHHALLVSATGHLESASEALSSGFSEEVVLVGLHGALADLGELTGETAIDDILNRIFTTFCIGK